VTVLVAIPYFDCPRHVERAVRSVLAQTVTDIHVLVVGDGQEPPLRRVRDSRLDVFTLPANRGNYFVREVMLRANPHPWYAPHDADDWSDPDHLERLFAMGSDAVATGPVWLHRGNAQPIVWAGPPGRTARYHVGLFATARLMAVGGYNPAERIGQDTLLLRMLRITGDLRTASHPTYHRTRRPGSLTVNRATSHRSEAREAMKGRNRTVYLRCERLRDPEAIRQYRASIIPAEIADEVERHTEALRARLGWAVAA
jgi:glycosyltransferase involved in cell wall biosynthesis